MHFPKDDCIENRFQKKICIPYERDPIPRKIAHTAAVLEVPELPAEQWERFFMIAYKRCAVQHNNYAPLTAMANIDQYSA